MSEQPPWPIRLLFWCFHWIARPLPLNLIALGFGVLTFVSILQMPPDRERTTAFDLWPVVWFFAMAAFKGMAGIAQEIADEAKPKARRRAG